MTESLGLAVAVIGLGEFDAAPDASRAALFSDLLEYSSVRRQLRRNSHNTTSTVQRKTRIVGYSLP